MNILQCPEASIDLTANTDGKEFYGVRKSSLHHKISRILNRVCRDTRGASAVEFAIVAPVFLLLVLGSVAWGLYLGTSHSVAQLTADAARASVAGISDHERETIVRAHVKENVGNYPLVSPDRITVEAGPLSGSESQFRVAVRYDASHLPIWFLSSIVPLPSQTLERTSVVKRGGY